MDLPYTPCAPEPIDVQLLVNDQQVIPAQVRPGIQKLSFVAQPEDSQPESELRISFPDEALTSPGDLRPIAISPVTPSR